MAQHIVELEDRIRGVRQILKEIKGAIGIGSDMALQGEFNITQAEGIILQAQEALRVSQGSSTDAGGGGALRVG